MSVRLTWLGRAALVVNPAYVVGPAWAELRRHYPRSTSNPSMYQQWECHATGAAASANLATLKYDLEGYRKNYPNWRDGAVMRALKAAIKSGNPSQIAVACNW